jgi:excisionase family DNA binding protein
MSAETFYTAHEVAERLKLTPATIHRYIRTGKLQATRIGRNYRISENDLAALTNRKTAPKPQRTPRTQRERIAALQRGLAA